MERAMAKKILVIDDDPAFLRLIEQVLAKEGFETLKAAGGQEGLRLLFNEKPDMVLLDVSMFTVTLISFIPGDSIFSGRASFTLKEEPSPMEMFSILLGVIVKYCERSTPLSFLAVII